MSLIDVGKFLYISTCWWCWCVCLDVAGCLLSELESAGEVELFCSLNCRETADNAAAAGYQLPAAAAPVSWSQLRPWRGGGGGRLPCFCLRAETICQAAARAGDFLLQSSKTVCVLEPCRMAVVIFITMETIDTTITLLQTRNFPTTPNFATAASLPGVARNSSLAGLSLHNVDRCDFKL